MGGWLMYENEKLGLCGRSTWLHNSWAARYTSNLFFFFFNLISCSLPSFSWKYPLAVSVLWHMMSCSWSSLIPAVTWLGFFLDFLEFLSWLMHLKLTFYTDDREEDVCSKDLRTCWIENSWLQNGKSESRLKMLAIAFEDTISAIQRRITCSV